MVKADILLIVCTRIWKCTRLWSFNTSARRWWLEDSLGKTVLLCVKTSVSAQGLSAICQDFSVIFLICLKVPFCPSEDRQEVLFDRINGISDNQAKGRQKQYISSVHLSLSQSLTVFCSKVQHIPRNIYDLDPDLHIDFFKYPCNQFVSLCYIAPLPTHDRYLSTSLQLWTLNFSV